MKEYIKDIIEESLKDEVDVDREWERLFSSIEKKTISKMKTRGLFLQYLKYAAAVVLGIGVSLSTLYLTNQENLSTVGNYKLVTSKGEKSYLQLPDGTRVWLNSCTTLEYAENYGHSNRSIYLDGEAYFEVTKNASAPFHVYVEGGEVTVLGTSFNVSAYKEDAIWQTTLVSGRVQVVTDDSKVVVKPTEQYSIDRQTGERVLKEVDTELYTSWVDGKFYFSAYAFEDIVRKLERWYDFTMNYQDEEIKRMHFSGTINKHRPLNEVLQFLEKTTDIHFEISGKNITVSKIKKG